MDHEGEKMEEEDEVVQEIDVWLTQDLAPGPGVGMGVGGREEGGSGAAAGAGGVGTVTEGPGGGGGDDEGPVGPSKSGAAGRGGERRGLYLVQYPLRPKGRPYPLDEECVGVRLKPQNQRLEIELVASSREAAGMIDEHKDREGLRRVGLLGYDKGGRGGKGKGKGKAKNGVEGKKRAAAGSGSGRTRRSSSAVEVKDEEGEGGDADAMDVDEGEDEDGEEWTDMVGPKDFTTAALRELHTAEQIESADYVRPAAGGEDMALRLVLSSGPPAEHKGTYCIGVLRGSGLHLTPLDAVVQMRPSLRHLDAANKVRAERKGGSHGGGEGDGATEVPHVLVTSVKKRETDRQEQLRKQSHSYLKDQMDKEEWVGMEMVPRDRAGEVYERLIADTSLGPVPTRQGDDTAPWFVAHLGKSLDDVLGTAQGGAGENGAGGEGVVVHEDLLAGRALNPVRLRGLQPEERVKLLLTHCHVLPFMTVRQNMDDSVLDGNILHHLEQHGSLVRGCWVESAECRPLAGSAAALHNWLCLRFALGNGQITKAELAGITEPPRDRVREHLQTMAHAAGAGAWEFKVPLDTAFVAQHPDLVERHEDAWKERGQGIEDEFERVCKAKKPKAKVKPDAS